MARKREISPDLEQHVHCEHVAQLEHDIRDLKRRLADAAREDPMVGMKGKIKRTGRSDTDWMDDLADQDRRHFERKLGIKR